MSFRLLAGLVFQPCRTAESAELAVEALRLGTLEVSSHAPWQPRASAVASAIAISRVPRPRPRTVSLIHSILISSQPCEVDPIRPPRSLASASRAITPSSA